mmetsp:Transcript_48830/g.87934  ORF Transcript_48830/g.87934 Transcript_48830/m.87934 type:complete len:252 (-) Transcript_48830:93-848(-)|eukprot:CAMPEP_0197624694 /NCGR_PEP_ID=MMETSP1338-20131121/4255_1 /TAXON_ID=43686 ORGANISM="Pelagodinium beii, Strain RCC1491" /NCGR_SAMPLE_ID=MMETSP1338 /ASSEMBLY_ACC=CAM_ASM_000754 /LENGTH=251 /DNA_ID=CAMNT_0043194887 /DNA_START=31 /DNA_END=783 /DNA_ORIENTATION=+
MQQANLGLPDPPPSKKVKEWSPIDRMLANKRSSKSASPKPPKLQAASNDLPPLSNPPSAPGSVRTTSAQTQTTTWEKLIAEAVAPEKQRCTSLQAELKTLKAQLQEKERELHLQSDAKALAAELEQRWASERAELQAQAAAFCHERDAARAELETQRMQWLEKEKELRSQIGSAQEYGKSTREDLTELREKYGRSQEDVKGLHKQIAALREENAKVAQERDQLLQRLEDEQREMMARVDAVEQRLLQKAGK